MAKASQVESTQVESKEEHAAESLTFEDHELRAPFVQWPKAGGLIITGKILGFFESDSGNKRGFKPRKLAKLLLLDTIRADRNETTKDGEKVTKLVTYPSGTAVRVEMPAGLLALTEVEKGRTVRITCQGKQRSPELGTDVWTFKVQVAK
jgi:hypothetical protein